MLTARTEERRRAPRRRIDLMLNAYQNGFPRMAMADNLSETGIRLRRVLEPSQINSGPIELEFQLPNDAEIFYVRGRCVYESSAHGFIGVRFDELTPHQRAKVKSFVHSPHVRLN